MVVLEPTHTQKRQPSSRALFNNIIENEDEHTNNPAMDGWTYWIFILMRRNNPTFHLKFRIKLSICVDMCNQGVGKS